jgi:hypothetical protein
MRAQQVGSKTTLRIQNRQYCGYAEKSEWCVYYSKSSKVMWHGVFGFTRNVLRVGGDATSSMCARLNERALGGERRRTRAKT